MKRSLRKQVGVLLAGTMVASTVLAQTTAFADEASDAAVEAVEVQEVEDATVTGAAVTSTEDVEEVVDQEIGADPIVVLADAATTGSGLLTDVQATTGFQLAISTEDKAKTEWKVNDTLSVDLLFNDLESKGVNNFTIELEYNSNVIDLASVEDGDVVYTDGTTTYQLLSKGRVKTQFDAGTTDENGMKTVVLAAVAGLADDGTNITPLDKNYAAKGSVLSKLTFEVKSLGQAKLSIKSLSDKATLNTVDENGNLVNVAVVAETGLVGDSINMSANDVVAEADYTIAPEGYDFSIVSDDNIISVAGALQSGSQSDSAGMHTVNLINDADIAGLVDTLVATTVENVTITKVDEATVTVAFKKDATETSNTFKFVAAKTAVSYSVTSNNVTLAHENDAVTVTGADLTYADGTATLANNVDTAAYVADLVTKLNKIEYVTAEAVTTEDDKNSTTVVTITFLKPADIVAKKTNEVKDVHVVTFVSAKEASTQSTKFTVSGEGKSVEVEIAIDGGVVSTKVNGTAVTLTSDDGKVIVPVNFDFSAATADGITFTKGEGTVAIGNDTKTVKLVRFGDVTLDGKILTADFAQVKADAIDSKDLTGVASKLADVNNDGKIATADFAQVKAKAIGGDVTFKAETDAGLK